MTASGLPTRRRALVTFTGTAAALGLLHVNAAASAPASDLPALWMTFLRAQGALTVTQRAQSEAKDRLPWWAKEGPSFIDHNGQLCGDSVGWPARQDVQPPNEPGNFRLVRVGPHDVEDWFRHTWGSPAQREAFAVRRDQMLADLAERVAAQEAERAKVGLPEIKARYGRLCDAMLDAKSAITNQQGASLDLTAARVILTAYAGGGLEDTTGDDPAMEIAALALTGLLPHLTGELAVDASEFVNNPTRPLRLMRVSLGIGTNGATVSA